MLDIAGYTEVSCWKDLPKLKEDEELAWDSEQIT